MKSLDDLLVKSNVDLSDWPSNEEELDAFLIACDGCDLGIENHDARISNVFGLIDESPLRPISIVSHESQGCLFDLVDPQSEEPSDTGSKPLLDYAQIVREAYLEVYDGFSTDRVVADPDQNCLFVQACWKRGAQASQADLNRLLLNARKAKKIGKVEGVKPYRVAREQLDKYLFASEISWRLLQDIENYKNGRRIALDDVLCDPKLGKSFVSIASSITPGYKPVDYRWAALTVRKAFNRRASKATKPVQPVFDTLGLRDQIRPSRLPIDPGFFWLKSGDFDFYIGHTSSVRKQIELLIDTGFEEKLAEVQSDSLFEPEPFIFSIASFSGHSASKRDPVKRMLVEEFKPRMNVERFKKRKKASLKELKKKVSA